MGFEPTTLRVLDRMLQPSELLRTCWRARVIFVGWTCEPHLVVTKSIASNTFRFNCITHFQIAIDTTFMLYFKPNVRWSFKHVPRNFPEVP